MSATITASDGTVLILDEVVLDALASMHGVGPHLRKWRLGDPKGKWVLIGDATVTALVIEACEFLMPIQAYCKLTRPGQFHVLTPWDGFAHPIGEGGPTKCQAWISAYNATKDQTRPPKVDYRDQVTSLVKALEQIERPSNRHVAQDMASKALEHYHASL